VCFSTSTLQLFETLSKRTGNLRNDAPAQAKQAVENERVPGSLFENFYQKNDHKINSSELSSEKITNNNKVSLFGKSQTTQDQNTDTQARHIDRDEIDFEVHSFLEKSRKLSSKIKNNGKTLSSLNSRIEELIALNKDVTRDVKKFKTLKKEKNELESKVSNFIEKYENEVQDIKSTIMNKSHQVEKTMKDKARNFDQVYHGVVSQYNTLQNQLGLVKKSLDKIKRDEQEKFNQMKKQITVDDLTVKKKLDVNGVAFIDKINTDMVDLGNIQIDSDKLVFKNQASKIMIGNDVITVNDFFNVVKTMKYLQSKCGQNLENCKPIDNKFLKEQENKEMEILNTLKTLRKKTSDYLIKKRN